MSPLKGSKKRLQLKRIIIPKNASDTQEKGFKKTRFEGLGKEIRSVVITEYSAEVVIDIDYYDKKNTKDPKITE